MTPQTCKYHILHIYEIIANNCECPNVTLWLTFCFGLTRANTRMWGNRVWSSRGLLLNLASPSPVTHKSNSCTNEDREGGGTGTRTLPSMDSQCQSPLKENNFRHSIFHFSFLVKNNLKINNDNNLDSLWSGVGCKITVCSFWIK